MLLKQSLAHWKHNIKKGGDTQKATLHDAPRVLLSDQYDSWIRLFWNMSLCVGSEERELYVDVGDGAWISKPISETGLNLVSDAKCMQWNFHQNPSISSKSQKNLQLFSSCSPWRWPLVRSLNASWFFEPSILGGLTSLPPLSAQTGGRFTVPHDGEWWAIDRAQAAVTYTLALNTLQRKLSCLWEVPSDNRKIDPLYPLLCLCCSVLQSF